MTRKIIISFLFSLICICACSVLEKSSEPVETVPISSECTYLYSVPYAILLPAYKITQGGTMDGIYYYQDFHKNDYDSNQEDNVNYIVKYDIQSGEKVLRSEPLHLNHANDMTLNPNTGYLYVVHNQPNPHRISVLETETLTVVDTFDIDHSIFSLDFNASRNQYVAGLSGGQSFLFLDENFQAASPVYDPCPFANSYTTQGVACDDDYIYFVLYEKENNIITVYDWNGKFVSYLSIDVGTQEPENITSLDGVLYVGCGGKTGLDVYRCVPEGLND